MALIRDLGNQLRQSTSIGGVQADVYGGILIARPGDIPVVAPSDGSLAIQPLASTGNQALDLIQGLDGIITKQQMALREADRIARDLAMVAERTAKFYGDTVIRGHQNAVSLEGFTQGASFMGGGVPVAPPVAPPSDHGSRLPEGAHVAPGTPPGPWDDTTPAEFSPGDRKYSRGGWMKPWGPGRPRRDEDAGWHNPASWNEGREMGEGMSLSRIRQNAARGMTRRLSEWNLGPNIAQDAHGKWHYAAGEEIDGVKVGGRFLSEEAAHNAQRLRSISGGVKNFVAGVGEDGSLSSGLGAVSKGAGKALGYAAIAWEGYNRTMDFAEDQRRENLKYQQVLGGSNAEGFGERFSENVFRWGQRGLMGSQEAEALYEGALDIYGTGRGGGYDQMRARAQNVGTTLYSQAGMSPDETLKFIQQAAKSGSSALEELGQALLSTTKAAREAGVNAKEARQNFERIYQSTAQYGAAGAAAAGATASAQARMGEDMQSWDFTGLQGQMQTYMLAAATGQNPNAIAAKRATATGQAELAQAQQKLFQQEFHDYFDAEGWKIIKSKGGTISSDEQWHEFAVEMVPHFRGDPWATAHLLKSQGWPTPPGDPGDHIVDLVKFFLQMLLKENPLGADDKNLNAQAGAEKRTADRLKGPNRQKGGDLPGSKDWESQDVKDYLSDIGVAKGTDIAGGDPSSGYVVGMTDKGKAAASYMNIIGKNEGDDRLGGQRNFMAEGLLRTAFDKDAKYIVRTEKGPREVDFDELVRFYRDQLATGDVWISEGGYKGKTVAEALGVEKQGKGEETQSAKTNPGVTGMAVDQFETTRHPETMDKIHITIGLDPDAKGLITATTDGTSTDRRAGTASPTSHDPNARASGNPGVH